MTQKLIILVEAVCIYCKAVNGLLILSGWNSRSKWLKHIRNAVLMLQNVTGYKHFPVYITFSTVS